MTKGIADSATSGRRFIDDDIAKSIRKLAEQIAGPDLPEQLLQFAGQFVAHDLTTMTRYSPFSKPEYLLHTGPFDAALEDRYLADYYRFDPFYRYWKSEERSGVICLRDVASPDVKQGRYVREFLAQLAISDEVGVFLPPVGRASVALFLERCSGKFRKHELAKLRRIYPVLAGLFQAHVGTLFGGTAFASETGSALSAKRPVLVTDQSGQEIFANAAWQALMAMESESILKAMAWCQESNEAQTPIVNDRVLLLSSLNNTLRVAPGCIVWSVDKLDRPPAESIHKIAQQLFESTLTRREREIVALILRGYPTSIIAKKLVVKPGTVKNHRRNIYLKLDITTERELFLRYVDAIVQART